MSSRLSKCEIQVLTVAHTHTFICSPVQNLHTSDRSFPYFLTHRSLWERLSLIRWCNCSVTASSALWVTSLRWKLWGLEPLVDLQRGSCPPGRTACSIKASCKRPAGDLESSRVFRQSCWWNQMKLLIISWSLPSYLTPAMLETGFKCLVSCENAAHPQVPQAELCKYLEMFCHVYMLMI